MADSIHQESYDWAPIIGEHHHVVGLKAWDEGGKGWIIVLFRDHMRREEFSAAFFVQSFTHWNAQVKTDPRAPVSVTLDLGNVTYTNKEIRHG